MDKKGLNTPLIKKKVEPLPSDRTDQGYDYSLVGPPGYEAFEENPEITTPKKEEKKTNFNEEFQMFKNHTEMSIPFTMTQFEDVLYVREDTLLTLQYIFYQKGQKTTLLQHIPLDETLEDGTKVPVLDDFGKPIQTQIGVENYQQDIYQDDFGKWNILKRNPNQIPKMSMFNNGAKFYTDSTVDYEMTRDVPLMEASNSAEEIERLKEINEEDDRTLNDNEYYDVYTDYAQAEGLISIFKTDSAGRMIKRFETSFSTNLPFKHTKDGNMLLVQSNDHKTVSLAFFDPQYDSHVSKIEADGFMNDKKVFKVMAWNLTEDDTLEEFTNLDAVNQGIYEYYNSVKNSFINLSEVKFIDTSKYVMLSYVEKQDKNHDYETFNGDPAMAPFFAVNHSKVKKANKYVIFDTANGKPILEWGGCYFGINQVTGQYDIYYLGLLPVLKVTGVELYFFYGGNILEFPSEANTQKEFDWTWSYLTVPLKELSQDKLSNKQSILNQISTHRQRLSHDQEGVFRMRSSMFTLTQDWQMDVSISINKDKKQFGFLNYPSQPNEHNKKAFYLYHTESNTLLENRRHAFGSSAMFGKDEFMPIVERSLPKDSIARQGRNFQNKDLMYFMQIRAGGKGGTGICINLDEFGQEQAKSHYQITLTEDEHPYSMIDIMCYSHTQDSEKEDGNFDMSQQKDVIQAIFIKNGDQQLMLKTRLPSTKGSNEIIKSSKSIQWQEASYPVIAYNLGIHKIAIMNQQDHEDPKQYILELDEEEAFICFLDFNKYEDFGFYPDAMRIYGCSQILFASKIGEKVHISLILYDPFYEQPQIAVLRSSNFIPFKKFNCEEDLVYRASIVPSKKTEGDDNFRIFALIMHEHLIHRSPFVAELDDGNADDSCDEEADRFFDGDSDDNEIPRLENVVMQQDTKNFLYYVTKAKGQMKIMEVNPRDSALMNHTCIFEIKCENCLGFQQRGENFYFIDEYKTIHVLTRIFDSRDLRHVKELNIKEVSRPDFQAYEFEPIVITEEYILSNGKIYYLYEENPAPHGIFESEDLVRMEGLERAQSLIRFKGPVEFKGSNQFFNVYKTGEFRCHMKIYEKPDSSQKTLINDFMHLVDVSTFLGDGNVLVKALRRYMIFDEYGSYIDEVDFEPIQNKDEKNEILTIIKENMQARVKEAKKQAKLLDAGEPEPLQKQSTVKEKDSKPKSIIPIGLNNMRDLLQFSQNNEYWVFVNRLTFALDLYKLTQVSIKESQSMYDDGMLQELSDDETYLKYQFVKVYSLDFQASDIYNSYIRAKDLDSNLNVQTFIEENVSVSVENNGDVSMLYIINQPQLKNVLVEIAMFSQDNKPGRSSKSIVKSFNQEVGFTPEVVDQLKDQLEKKKQGLREQIALIKIRQERLPKNLQDNSSIKLIEDKIHAIEQKIKHNLITGKVIGNIAVVYCSNQLKYSRINKCRLQKFEQLGVDFDKSVEIQRVLRTLNDNILQIVATEWGSSVFIVMTWDFENHLEVSMYQQPVRRENQANYVVQGMYQKLNYYMNGDYIIDLEFGMPYHANTYQSVAGFQSITHQLACVVKWANQRKIFKETTRFLDVEAPYIMNVTQTRMDMLFWDNFYLKGENLAILKSCMKLSQFAQLFNGQSLWHHYAGNADMIQFVHDKFLLMKAEDKLTNFEGRIPLMLLQPDKKGYSALYYSIQLESPKSFELMVHILNDFDNICISKMILKSLPVILAHQSPKVIEFFETAIYQTMTMTNPLLIPFPEELDEFVFPCNTSIISQKLVQTQMGTLKEEKSAVEEKEKKISKGDKIKLYEEMLKSQEIENEKQKALIQMKTQLKKKVLECSFVNDDDSNMNRVEVVAHEFDWLFEGDNLQNLIIILGDSANPECLTTEGIKTLVSYMWSEHYQSAILNWIFFPYIIYLLLMTYICSSAIRLYLVEIENLHLAPDDQPYTIDQGIAFKAQISTTATFCFFVMFATLEGNSFIADGPKAYFSQTWNCIDFISLSLNFSFLSIAALCQIREAWVIEMAQLLSIGAYATFFMWCKMFYWMRLFESTAYYVTLIVQTISDCMTFMLMILIILLAFGNFFMVINQNMEGREDGNVYVTEYLGIKPVDALISAYFMGLGEFAYDGYSFGPNKYSAWSMFLMATFLTCVVFMNMLIAIMGETFGAVTEKAEQNGLKEQINLINDHIWLLDLKKTFKNQKYLIIVRKTRSAEESEEQVSTIIQNLENSLSHKYDRLHQIMMRRLDGVDNLTRALFKAQGDQSAKMNKLVTCVRTSEHTLNDVSRQISEIKK